ncbi:MAG: PorT family protein [Prevotellaceae bacterium]|jgi:hypothetical protein|nr:PorT family protein [Prevotellaceae bacterium]
MKRVIFVVAVVMIGNATFGQLKFGAKAGLNVASVWGVTEVATTYMYIPGPSPVLAGAALGGFVRYDFKEITWLGVQLDMMFSMQGGRDVSYWQMGEHYTIHTLRQSYINVPFVLEIKPFRKVPLGFLIGYQTGECILRYADGERVRRTERDVFYGWDDNSLVLGFRYVFSERLTAELRIINSGTSSIVIDETWRLLDGTSIPPNYVYKSIGAQNLVG